MLFDPDRLFHIGYVVPDMNRAIKLWQRQGARVFVPPAADPIQNVQCSFLIYRSTPIELVAPLASGKSPIEARLRKGGGLDHVCLFTDDLDRDLAEFREAGGTVVVEPCYGAVFDRILAFVVLRTGLVIELMTRTRAGRGDLQDPLEKYFSALAGLPG